MPKVVHTNMRSLVPGALCLWLTWLTSSLALGQSTLDFTYEGRLTEESGKPVEGPISMQVDFFHQASGGSPILTVTDGIEHVPLLEGVFQIRLTLSATDYHSVFSSVGQAVYIQISDLTHNPRSPYSRQRVGLLPYAAKVPVDGKTITFTNDGRASLAVSGSPTAGQFLTFDGSGQLIWSIPTVAGVTQVGGVQASDVAAGATLANNATTSGTADTLVKRDSNGGFSAGAITATATAPTQNALVIKGAASQSADLQQWQNSSGDILSAILSDGSFTMKQPDAGTNYVSLKAPAGMTSSATYTLPSAPDAGKFLTTDSAGVLSWDIPAAASVSADHVTGLTAGSIPFTATPATDGLTEDTGHLVWDNVKKAMGLGTASPMETLTVNGGAKLGQAPASATVVAAGGVTSGATTLNVSSTVGYPSSGTLIINSEAMTYTGTTATTFSGLTRGAFGTAAASHTAAATVNNAILLLVGDGSGTPKMTALGNGRLGVGTMTPSAQLEVVADSDHVAATVRGNSSQTADLQQWQNNAGTSLAAIDATGGLKMKDSTTNYVTLKAPSALGANTTYTLPASIQANKYLSTDSSGVMSWVDIGATSAASGTFSAMVAASAAVGSVPATVKGAASQTANLQEWQTSGGVVLSKIDKDGYLTLPGVPTDPNHAATKGYVDSGLSAKEASITAGTTAQFWRGDKTWQTLDTAAIPENTNLYYTDARAKAVISATTPLSYSITTGQMDLGTVPLAKGGTGADLSATGGAGKFVKQSTAGANLSVGSIGASDLPVMVASGASHAAGAVPDPGASAGTTKFLREDATWQTLISASTAYGAHASAGANSIYVDSAGKVGIGTTGPSASLDITPAANTIGLQSTGYSLTGANAQSLVNFTGTWNTTGAPTLIKANVTNTASDAASLLLDLQVGGASKFSVAKDGTVTGIGSGLTSLSASALPSNVRTRSIGYVFDGAGAALSSGRKSYYTVPFACTIAAWSMTVDTGTATVDVWKIAAGTAIPTVANTITASATPAISTGTAKRSTTLTGWSTSVTANDIIGFNLSAVSGATNVSLVLECNQ